MDERFDWARWVQMRPVVTRRYAELEGEDLGEYVGPAVQMGSAWYDRPVGTTDLEGTDP